MPPPRASRSSCSTSARTADRPEPPPGSRTISAFRLASRARPWLGARSARRRNSAPRSPFRSRWRGSIAVAASCPPATPPRLELVDGRTVRARTVVIASGARYRRPDISNLSTFEGAGISYWASPVEAKLCEGEEVALIGGGNSAGQAVVYLAPRVKHLHLIVRGTGLEATMSRYLVDRIAALQNVDLHVGKEVVALEGDQAQGLTAAVLRQRAERGNPRLPAAPSLPVHRRRSEHRLAAELRCNGSEGLRRHRQRLRPRRQPDQPPGPAARDHAAGRVRDRRRSRRLDQKGCGRRGRRRRRGGANPHRARDSGTARLTTPNLPYRGPPAPGMTQALSGRRVSHTVTSLR